MGIITGRQIALEKICSMSLNLKDQTGDGSL